MLQLVVCHSKGALALHLKLLQNQRGTSMLDFGICQSKSAIGPAPQAVRKSPRCWQVIAAAALNAAALAVQSSYIMHNYGGGGANVDFWRIPCKTVCRQMLHMLQVLGVLLQPLVRNALLISASLMANCTRRQRYMAKNIMHACLVLRTKAMPCMLPSSLMNLTTVMHAEPHRVLLLQDHL